MRRARLLDDADLMDASTPLVQDNRLRSGSENFQRPTHGKRSLGVLAVVFVTWFNVCGGPWGTEEIIADAGPLPGLVGLLIFALCWGLPLALVTAEMSSLYPDNGGYSIWVSEAFGEFWGFQHVCVCECACVCWVAPTDRRRTAAWRATGAG